MPIDGWLLLESRWSFECSICQAICCTNIQVCLLLFQLAGTAVKYSRVQCEFVKRDLSDCLAMCCTVLHGTLLQCVLLRVYKCIQLSTSRCSSCRAGDFQASAERSFRPHTSSRSRGVVKTALLSATASACQSCRSWMPASCGVSECQVAVSTDVCQRQK